MKKIILVTSTDLLSNERAHLLANSLFRMGYQVRLVSMRAEVHRPLPATEYKVNRLRTFFYHGIAGAANRVLSLFFFLLSKKAHLLICLDQGALVPTLVTRVLKQNKLILDYSGVYLDHRIASPYWYNKLINLVRLTSDGLLHGIIPSSQRLHATLKEQGKKVLPALYDVPQQGVFRERSKNFKRTFDETYWDIPAKGYDFLLLRRIILAFAQLEKRKLLLYIGPIEKNLGLELVVRSMEFVPNACLLLLGSGRFYNELKFKAKKTTFSDRIGMPGAFRYDQLAEFIPLADLGICVTHTEMDDYKRNLPYAVSRFIHAGVPILTNTGNEIEALMQVYQVGTSFTEPDPEALGNRICQILENTEKMDSWKRTTIGFSSQFNWNTQEPILKRCIEMVLPETVF